jgi:hypothetical protein
VSFIVLRPADTSTLWIWANAAIDILSARHAHAMVGASFLALVNLELDHGRRLCAMCFLHPSVSYDDML